MQEKIILDGKVVEYELKISVSRKRSGFARMARRASVRMVVDPEKGLVVTISKCLSRKDAEEFIRSKAVWVVKNIERYEKNKVNALPKLSAKEITKVKEQALVLAAARLSHFNTYYQLPYKDISIRNQKTRWGSCSQKKNLSFNYKIALLPSHLSDYIIVHELCHVAQMNHSVKFWSLVMETIPEYAERRKELRIGVVHPG